MSDQQHEWRGPIPSRSPETAPFWEGCNDSKFLLQRCNSCGKVQYHYRAFCCHCWSDDIEDFASNGEGTIWTYSIVYKNRSAAFVGQVPYVVLLVELEGGVKVFGNLVGCENHDEISVGMPVRLEFAKAPEGQHVPVFALAGSST